MDGRALRQTFLEKMGCQAHVGREDSMTMPFEKKKRFRMQLSILYLILFVQVLQMTGPIIHFHGTGGCKPKIGRRSVLPYYLRKFERNHAIGDKKWKEL